MSVLRVGCDGSFIRSSTEMVSAAVASCGCRRAVVSVGPPAGSAVAEAIAATMALGLAVEHRPAGGVLLLTDVTMVAEQVRRLRVASVTGFGERACRVTLRRVLSPGWAETLWASVAALPDLRVEWVRRGTDPLQQAAHELCRRARVAGPYAARDVSCEGLLRSVEEALTEECAAGQPLPGRAEIVPCHEGGDGERVKMTRKVRFGGNGRRQGDASADAMGTVRRSPDGVFLAMLWPSPLHPDAWLVADRDGSVGYELPSRVAHWPVIGAVPGSPAAGARLEAVSR